MLIVIILLVLMIYMASKLETPTDKNVDIDISDIEFDDSYSYAEGDHSVDDSNYPYAEGNKSVDSYFHSHMSCDWDAEDSYLLAKIAMAEAEGEDTEGKALVIMVVLNRMIDPRVPNTIRDVIYDSGQFEPIITGRFDAVEPNEDCVEALSLIMNNKWDNSQGALYFESNPNLDNWHSRNLKYLFTHGGHRFYK